MYDFQKEYVKVVFLCRIEKILLRIISKDISVAIYEYNPKGIERKNGEKYWLTKIEDNKKEGKE